MFQNVTCSAFILPFRFILASFLFQRKSRIGKTCVSRPGLWETYNCCLFFISSKLYWCSFLNRFRFMSMHPLKSFFRNLIKNANLFLFVVDCLLLAFYFIENFFFFFCLFIFITYLAFWNKKKIFWLDIIIKFLF